MIIDVGIKNNIANRAYPPYLSAGWLTNHSTNKKKIKITKKL